MRGPRLKHWSKRTEEYAEVLKGEPDPDTERLLKVSLMNGSDFGIIAGAIARLIDHAEPKDVTQFRAALTRAEPARE